MRTLLRPRSVDCDLVGNFIVDNLFTAPGASIEFKDFYAAFLAALPATERPAWSKIRLSRALPDRFPVGRRTNGRHHVGNLSFMPMLPRAPLRRTPTKYLR